MTAIVLVCSSLLAVVIVLALAREIRLRRALESLLRRLLSYWRSHEERQPRDTGRPVDTAADRLHE